MSAFEVIQQASAPLPAAFGPGPDMPTPAVPREAAWSSSAAARELDDEVARLLRVRSGELAEPLLWSRPTHRNAVETVVRQLQPIRSRGALFSSWEREGRRSPEIRLAYAIACLSLQGRGTGAIARRARRRTRVAPLRAAG
jgi:hypothetical protein